MKKHKAVFTIVKNERVMLPLWLKYYLKYFSPEDTYVLDHQTTDGSTDGLPCNKKVVRSDFAFDHHWLNRVVRNYQIELLQRYKYVLFVECDEFVFHPDGLDQYIDNLSAKSARCNGFELQHVTGREPAIDLARPILDQRSYWYPNIDYCKTLISSVPIHWDLGFHICDDPGKIDPHLYLAHLHRFDYGIALEKNIERSRMNWSKADIQRGHGFQNRILGDDFARWFEEYRTWGVIERIPDEVKLSHAF